MLQPKYTQIQLIQGTNNLISQQPETMNTDK